MRLFYFLLSPRIHRLLWCLCPALTASAALAGVVPHLNPQGQADYQQYLNAAPAKAFAIAPGGAWGWAAEQLSNTMANTQALAACQVNTKQKCVLYASDQQVVFEAEVWPHLLGPYLSAAQARQATVGREVGQRFTDLAFYDLQGAPLNVSSFKGRALILHFWGSWCGPCRSEMPQLQAVYKQIKSNPQLALVLLQVREPISTSKKWLVSQALQLPLYDSGASGLSQPSLHTRTGEKLHDRSIASVFPSTYVLDKNGVVVFSHFGPIEEWQAYLPFLLDVAQSKSK